jgi:predicted metal-dependent peptidase
MNAEEKVNKAKAQIVLHHRFFATVMMTLQWQVDTSCPTGWTDGRTIAYNPTFIDGLTEKQTIGFIVHEVFHVINRHHLRRNNRDPKDWNVACDYASNPVIIDMRFELPPHGLFRRDLKDKAAEQIFGVLKGEQEKQAEEQKKQQDQQSHDDGAKDDSEQESADAGEEGEEDQEDAGTDASDGKDDDNKEDAGDGDNESAAGKEDGEGEEGAAGDEEGEGQGETPDQTDPGECGEVRDMKNEDGSDMSEAEQTVEENRVQVMIAQAGRIATQAGQMQGLERVIKELQKPEVDWREELKPYIQQYVRNDFTWQTPSRKHILADLYLPSMRSQELDDVVLVIDVSGSINDRIYTSFMANVKDLLEEFKMRLTIICCDDHITEVFEDVTADTICEIKPRYGGGTDFKPPFVWLAEQGIDPTLLLYFTDLECYSYPVEPSFPVIWAAWSGWYGGKKEAPFGVTIHIN